MIDNVDYFLKTFLSGCNWGKLVIDSFNDMVIVGFNRDENFTRAKYLVSNFLSSYLKGLFIFSSGLRGWNWVLKGIIPSVSGLIIYL